MASALNLVKGAGREVFAEPAGGMFIWIRHPDIVSSGKLVAQAKRTGISLTSGHFFLPQSDDSPCLRINVAYTQDKRAAQFIGDPSTCIKGLACS